MHRTEGDGYVTESGKRRFKDRNLPTYIGTVDTAEYNNAVQEELCNLIVALGGTVEPDAATDRTNAWEQIATLLLASAKITDAAMSDFDLAKGFGDILTTDGGALYIFSATPNEAGVYSTGVAAKVTTYLSANPASNPGLYVYDDNASLASQVYKGVKFAGGPGESAYDNIQYRKAAFRFDLGFTALYAVPATPDTIVAWNWNGGGSYDTDIPFTVPLIGATLLECDGSGTLEGRVTPIHINTVDNGAGFHRISEAVVSGVQTGPSGTNVLLLEFDATLL